MSTQSETLQVAVDAVALACRVSRWVQQDQDRTRKITKDDRSPVTVADYAVQAVVALELQRHLGPVPMIGEEHAGHLRDPEHAAVATMVHDAVRHAGIEVDVDEMLDAIDACDHDASADVYWTLDPVDGTKGFLRGQQYAVALARLERGRVVEGVLGCPNLPRDHDAPLDRADATGVLYAASIGGGATEMPADDPGVEPRPIRAASSIGDRMRVCESVEAAHSDQSHSHQILERLGVHRDPVRLDSQCKYAVVARGQADAYLRMPTRKAYVEKIWDHAAGSLVATEAGAMVSDITGAPLDFGHGARLVANRGVICAIEPVHARIIEAIADLKIDAPA
jgi:3'(2'), 5'-bisphosphate nucleotidase